jgi:broad specificity phosphatase PhoE
VNRLYLTRHGENWANLTKEFSCRHVDYSLTAKGLLQARQTAEFFRDKEIQGIFTSPLRRAVETVEIIAETLGLQAVVVEDFREVNVGDLELEPVSAEGWAFYGSVIDGWYSGNHDITFPGGEDYASLWNRMRSGVERVVAGRAGQNLVAVGHGGIFSFTLKDLCPSVDVVWLRSAVNHNCSITEVLVEQRDGRLAAELVTWASFSHLHGDAADLEPGTPRVDTFTSFTTKAQSHQEVG